MEAFIRKMIKKRHGGLINYAEYMEQALYHPEYGYYMAEKAKIGRDGDYITTSNFSDIYGNIMAKWYAGLCSELGIPAAVCELGGGNGRFAKAFLDGWKKYSENTLTYILVEASPYHQNLQRSLLDAYHHVSFFDSMSDIQKFSGLFFSNELFDALPVRVVKNEGGSLMEVMVGVNGEKRILEEVLVPLCDDEVKSFLMKEGYELAEGQRMEIPLAMLRMTESISHALAASIIVTADYGYRKADWMEPERMDGSLRGYENHSMVRNVLRHPGDMDITSHVHFDALISKGEECGMHFLEILPQDRFFLEIGILDELAECYDPNPFSETSRRNRAIRSLVMPGGISPYFHVIVQEKGLGLSNGLPGSKKAME
ncbi:class I SAM-dependent methyltransferase [Bacillus massilinigeriensis]|uniref:class I SAM-dependent methyltransferase n=1 Tax=Bacillus mediterraneensis TaxID=1805474 RepID=UPI0008F867ED|nr:SAM-dependent methyltransferase [Bacillus mediterraneensis]